MPIPLTTHQQKFFTVTVTKKMSINFLNKFPLDQQSIIELKNPKNRIKIIIGKDQVKHDKIISRTIPRKPKS